MKDSTQKAKIHFHSDCSFFAGCENMLVNFFNSDSLREEYEISFSYRKSVPYEKGLKSRSRIDFDTYALRLPSGDFASGHSGSFFYPFSYFFSRLMHLIALYPVALWQILILQNLFKKLKPDLLHINNGGYPGALSARTAAIAARIAGVRKIVFVVNNHAVTNRRLSRWPDYPIDWLVRRMVSHFITGSESARKSVLQVLKLREERVVRINNGITLRRPTESSSLTRLRLGQRNFQGLILGIVAVLRPNKGHIHLLNALKQLKEEKIDHRHLRLLIEGDGPLREALYKYVRANDLLQECVFVGSEENIANFYQILGCLILPSTDSEDFPNVILEGMGNGIPVIGSKIAGIPEQIDHLKTGLLVEPGNAAELAEAIKTLLQDSRLRKLMGSAAGKKFKHQFQAETSVKKYISLYDELLKEHH